MKKFVFSMLIFLVGLTAVHAVTVYVAEQGAHVAPFTSWENASTSIQAAVDAAHAGDLILISNGVYALSGQVVVGKAVTLQGLNGPAGTTIDGLDQTRCFRLTHQQACLDGLTITRGSAESGGGVCASNGGQVVNCVIRDCNADMDGGGLYMYNGTASNCQFIGNAAEWGGGLLAQDLARIRDCRFRGNHAANGGGGLYAWGAIAVNNCMADSNTAGWGAGMFLDETSVGSNCLVRNNRTDANAGGVYVYNCAALHDSIVVSNHAEWGGGIRVTETGCVLNCTVSFNVAGDGGGGLYLEDHAVVSNLQVVGNHADWGGGIRLKDNAYVYDCTVSNNSAQNGGGILPWGGHVSGLRIVNNEATSLGGGIYYGSPSVHPYGGSVRQCLIAGNVAPNGAGAYLSRFKGPLENCLVTGNHAHEKGGGLYVIAKCTVQSVTCSGNTADEDGGGVFIHGGTYSAVYLYNTIIWSNAGAGEKDYAQSGYIDYAGTFRNNCIPNTLGTPGQVTNAPLFVDPADGNYGLQSGSPCIDAGWVDDYPAFDLVDTLRPLDGNLDGSSRPDIGACEYAGDTLACSFYAEAPEGTPPFRAVFHVNLLGTNLTDLFYRWDFQADGTVDLQGPDLQTVSNIYAEGVYSVRLQVSNGGGESYTSTRTNYIEASQPDTFYVAPGGGHIPPFTNWVMAATNLQAVLPLARNEETVLVTNAVYQLDQQIAVTNGITIRGVRGPAETVFDGGGTSRCFYLSHTGAVLDNLTIMHGYALQGGGVYSACGGAIQHCRILTNTAYGYEEGGAVRGGGVYMKNGGRVSHCRFEGNIAHDGYYYSYHAGHGSAVWADTNAVIRNCLAIRNSTDGYGTLYGGFIDNCTIVKNTGHGMGCAHVRNTVCYDNSANWNYGCTYSNRFDDYVDPKFVDAVHDNYRLKPQSPWVNRGMNAAWMTNATDLDGQPRIMGGSVDFGAYETDTDQLGCWIAMTNRFGPVPVEAVLSSVVYGTNTTDLYFQWDVDGDGTVDFAGYGLHTVTSLLVEAGACYPTLYISNAIGQTAHCGGPTVMYQGYMRLTNYVSPAGAHVSPFTSWATAATNIDAAVEASRAWGRSGIVYVAEGTYREWVRVQNGITVKSVGGAGKTIIDGYFDGYHHLPCILHQDATLDGFTITRFKNGLEIYEGRLLHCRVVDNSSAYTSGGGVEINGPALVENCLIANNRCSDYESGGGICAWYTNAVIRNCIIRDNAVHSGTGGGVYGGRLYNCTIAGNYARWGGGVADATAFNCIIVSNHSGIGIDNYVDADIEYSCTMPMPHGPGNTDNDPKFAFPDRYQLAEDSPCVDAGTNMPWMAAATDFDGFGRIYNQTVDMGAYEFGYPRGGITVSPWNGILPLQVECTACIQGFGTGTIWYAWDFEQDGIVDLRITNDTSATHVYEDTGVYWVSLLVSNCLGDCLEFEPDSPVYVAADVLYVSHAGAHQFPYTNWAMASTSLAEAVNFAANDMTIWVTNGTYHVRELPALDMGVEMRSVNGAAHTVMDAFYSRCLYLSHSNAVVDGFTLRDGYHGQAGGCLYIAQGGTVKNCLIDGGRADIYGGNVFMLNGGLLTNCTVRSGQAMYGGGVFIKHAGQVHNCRIFSNSASRFGGGVNFDYGGLVADSVLSDNVAGSRKNYYTTYDSRGGGANFNEGGLLRNCLVTRNYAVDGAGVFNYEAHVESCTIADNESLHAGGAAVISDGEFKNTVMHGDENDIDVSVWVPGTFNYCCAAIDLAGPGNVNGQAGFIDPAAGNFQLRPGSPCINRGLNAAWMTGAHDMAGHDRILDGRVDIGACEYLASAGYCNFEVRHEGMDAWNAVFVPYVSGMTPGPVCCAWDFDDNGVADLHTDGLRTVTNRYADYGTYSVSLTVSNPSGAVAEYTQHHVVRIAPRTLYVSLSGQHVYPYTNWMTAATNPQAALDLSGDGSTVWVSNGCYGAGAPYVIARGARMRSMNGPAQTVIDGGHARQCLVMAHVNAMADGFTFMNGYAYTNGGGVYCAGVGTLTNCIIYNNEASQYGGGVWMYHRALLTDSHIFSNTAARYGGGVYCGDAARVEQCYINGNNAGMEGGGVYLKSARLENSVIVDNYAPRGGGIEMKGFYVTNQTIVSHCTVSANRAGRGSGVEMAYGRLINSMVYDNPGSNFSWRYASHLGSSVEGSLMNAPLEGFAVITNNPLFVDAAGGDYRVQPGSPAIDAGIFYPWTANDKNGVARPLDGDGDGVAGYDIGAYEVFIPGVDTDRDGLTDQEEIETYRINPVLVDTDGDRQHDRQELLCRTDPGNADDYFAVKRMRQEQQGRLFALQWMSSTDCLYTVYRTDSLTGEWTLIPDWAKMPGTGGMMSYTAMHQDEQGMFYRVMTYPKPGH